MNVRCIRIMFVALLALCFSSEAWAQRFAVESFKALPNDVSAFINPVRDLNDEDCGLIKVMASPDFVFSTPLGIVKRVDHTGEIWLYVPHGSKKITIKHAEWGVLRDYAFPLRIDSHMTYELRIDEPVGQIAAVDATPVVTTVVDTLVLTRVDTLIVGPLKKITPFNLNALATLNYGSKSKSLSGGILAIAAKRHGGFVHVMTDFGRGGATVGDCERQGEMNGSMPYYTGRTRSKFFMVNGGLAHRLSRVVTIFEGAGYGDINVDWELAASEGGGYVRNKYYSKRGISLELGVVLAFNRISVSAAAMTLKGSEWFGALGIGIRIGR